MPETHDLRPALETYRVMYGDPWSVEFGMGDENDAPMDLTGWTITAKGRLVGAAEPFDLTLATTPEGLAAGTFWAGVDAVAQGFTYSIQLAPPGGLPRTYFRGQILEPTRGADDA